MRKPFTDGEGWHGQKRPINIVAATTLPGAIIPALLTRLDLCELDPYLPAELKEIARDCAAEQGVHLTAQAARAIADRAQGSPRVTRRLVSILVLTNVNATELTQVHAEELFSLNGISAHRLTPGQQQCLCKLASAPAGRSSFERLVAQLHLDGNLVRRELEPFLIHVRAIVIEIPRMRAITELCRLILDELAQGTP